MSTATETLDQLPNSGTDYPAAEQVATLFNAIFSPEDVVEVRYFDHNEDVRWVYAARSEWIANITASVQSLASDNAGGWNIFFGANPRPAKGMRGDDNIRIARTVFADCDGNPTLDDVKLRIESAGLPEASVFNQSGRGIHAYWLLAGGYTDLKGWSELQKDLAKAIGGDSKVFNPERVMRLCGFTNTKKKKAPAQSVLLECHADRRFTFDELRAAVPPRPKSTPAPAPSEYRPSTLDDATRVKRCLAYVAKLPPSIEGEKGSDRMLQVACETFRFDLSEADRLHVMREYNATKAIPPWSEKEIAHKLKSAAKKVTSPGSRLRERDERRQGRLDRLRARNGQPMTAMQMTPETAAEEFNVDKTTALDDLVAAGAVGIPDAGSDLPPTAEPPANAVKVTEPPVAPENLATDPPDDDPIFSSDKVKPKVRSYELDKDGWPVGPNIIRYPEPMRLAEHFIEASFLDNKERILIRRFRKEWWSFVRGVGGYRQLPDEEMVARIYRHLDKLYTPVIDKNTKQPTGAIARIVAKSGNANEVAQALMACNTLVDGEMPQWLNKRTEPEPRDVVAFRNGLLNTAAWCAGEDGLLPPDPNWFSGVACPYAFNPEAKCPVWLETIHNIFNGDSESIALLQEWFGLQLVPDNRYEKIALLVGRPRSGKGTIITMLSAMLGGEQIAATSFAKLAGRFGLHPLMGRLAAILPDAHVSRSVDDKAALEVLKSVSGGDDQAIDRKGVSELPKVALFCRFTIAVNELPKLPDEAGALKPRLLLLNFPNTYAGREDHSLKRRLPEEAPGVALWSLQGLARLRANDTFTIPESSIAMVNEFERAVSPIKSFLFECAEISPDAWVGKSDMFEKWAEWCKERGTEPGDAARFGEHLVNAEPGKVSTGRRGPRGQQFTVYNGIRLCD